MAKWKKGQSGNPGGRPREIGDLRELARERTMEALDTLSTIMRDTNAPAAARVSAAGVILDRGYGKPAQDLKDNPIKTDTTHGVDSATLDRWAERYLDKYRRLNRESV